MKKRQNINAIEKQFASFFREHRRMPTYSEMLPLLGVKAKSAAEYWIKKLLEKGVLEKDAKGFLKPVHLSLKLPIAVSYTHLRAHETPEHLVCRLLLEKKKP